MIYPIWRLSENAADNLGLAFTDDGLLLGRTPLVERRDGRFVVRERSEIARLIKYSFPNGVAIDRLLPGLAAVASALNAKRHASGEIDVIKAQDIAQFPDNNLAESIQRVPGVSITRVAGEGRNISVRGLGPGFTRVRINGMEAQATAGGSAQGGGINLGRGFDFNVFASELFNSVTVRKTQQAELFFNGSPYNGVDTKLTTASVTPRLKIETDALGRPAKVTTGFDYYHTAFTQDRSQDFNSAPYHIYDIKQTTAAFYGNGTVALRPDTDLTAGVRYQRNTISARDTYDASAPSGSGDAQGLPLDKSEWKYAAQGGLEHRITPDLALFGHVAHSFRVPNADERVGQAVAFNFPAPTPTNFDLRTQTSNEVEGGVRVTLGPLKWQTSYYDMRLHDEIFYSPATGTNINLDPTHHYGVENVATLQVLPTVRLRGNLTYTRAVFTDGQFAGNDIPLISKWTANAGLTWNIWDKYVVYDVTVRYAGQRRLDNDSTNAQPLIPAHTLVDMRIGGEYKNAFWSLSVQNLFNDMYFDYGIASTATLGRYNAYPQPGRTVMARVGFNLP